jgi:type IV pilus assembly protein PilE
MRRKVVGFTLIELLIAVAVVAILASVAFSAYREQIRTTRRADAKAVLMEAAQFMERIYSETGCYDPGNDNDCATGVAGAPVLPYNKSPVDGSDSYYGIGVQAVTATTYILRADPTSGESQDGTGLLEVNELGQRFWDEDGSCGNDPGNVPCAYAAGERDWDKD